MPPFFFLANDQRSKKKKNTQQTIQKNTNKTSRTAATMEMTATTTSDAGIATKALPCVKKHGQQRRRKQQRHRASISRGEGERRCHNIVIFLNIRPHETPKTKEKQTRARHPSVRPNRAFFTPRDAYL